MRTLQEMTLQEKLGQRLAAGFQGLEPPEEFLRLIKEYKVGNIILFRRNIQDGPQLKKLCATLRKVVEEETGVKLHVALVDKVKACGGCYCCLRRDQRSEGWGRATCGKVIPAVFLKDGCTFEPDYDRIYDRGNIE